MQNQLSELLRREGVSDVQAEELAIVPGMDEIAALVQIGRQVRRGEYDCIIVDAAPTGETIRLLSMPDHSRRSARASSRRGHDGLVMTVRT